jgi:hypothetical protein
MREVNSVRGIGGYLIEIADMEKKESKIRENRSA